MGDQGSFSGALRTAAGSFTTRVFGWIKLQQVAGGDVGHVEGRILAHQDNVHGGEVHFREVAEDVVGAALALDGDGAGAGEQAVLAAFALALDAFAEGKVVDLVVPERVARGAAPPASGRRSSRRRC